MAQNTSSTAAHFTAFSSAPEEAATTGDESPKTPQEIEFDRRMEAEAEYCSRRAREERQASSTTHSRKCREVHLELAMAYELRAHLFTQELHRTAVSQLYAL